MWKERWQAFFNALQPEHREVFRDHSSQISYAWMLAMPLLTKPSLKLSNQQVSVGLTTRALNPGFVGNCPCGLRHLPSHDLSCRLKNNYRTARHEALKRLFAANYKTCHCEVRYEPISQQPTSRDRGDLSVQGPAALNGLCVLDFSVVSPINTQNYPIQRLLEERHNAKVDLYKTQFPGGEFFPVVMTTGGTLHPTAAKVLAKLAESGPGIQDLRIGISISLLKARSDYWYTAQGV